MDTRLENCLAARLISHLVWMKVEGLESMLDLAKEAKLDKQMVVLSIETMAELMVLT